MDFSMVAVILLLLAGVIGSLVPMAPGALFSLLGIAVYYFFTPDPGLIFSVLLGLTALMALATDWFAGSISAKYGGASNRTSLVAGITGFLGFVFLGGPIGLLIAVSVTVLIREYMIHGDSSKSFRAAAFATIGVLGSAAIQLLLTASILLAFLLALVI